MQLVGDFTDTNRIRGALGLDERDISDQQIIDMQLKIELDIEIFSWFPLYATQYDTWFNAGAPTTANQNNINLLFSYCTFQAAYLLATTLELIVQRSVTDSKMTASRFNSVDFDKIRSTMIGKANAAKTLLAAELSLTIGLTSAVSITSISPNFDPVTGV